MASWPNARQWLFSLKAFAAAMKGAQVSVKQTPGVLLDATFDKTGDIDSESFLVKVENGKQVVVATLPPAGSK